MHGIKKERMTSKTKIGLAIFAVNPLDSLKEKKPGLLCNPAALNTSFVHALKCIDQNLLGQWQSESDHFKPISERYHIYE